MNFDKVIRRRNLSFFTLFTVLLAGFAYMRQFSWLGSEVIHVGMEAVATILSFIVGVLALIHYYSKKEKILLFIGAGYLGTSFLDLYHCIVTSPWFAQVMPSPPVSLVPWSWVSSRVFLSILMFLSWYAWYRQDKQGGQQYISEKTVYQSVALFTILNFLFFAFYPLPQAYYPELIFGRPEEFMPAFFFLLALVGYYLKGGWKKNDFEYWLVLSLIIGFLSQAVYMSSSTRLYDGMFDSAHLLKKLSYICSLIGLLVSMYHLFKEGQTRTRTMELIAQIAENTNKTRDISESIPIVLKLFCKSMGWTIGHVYLRNGQILEPSEFWYVSENTNESKKFQEITMHTTFKKGVGLPGRIFESEQPAWIADITKDPNYLRAKLDQDIKFRAGIGFPIIIDGVVTMVMEFYSKEVLDLDQIVFEAMKNVGFQISKIFEKQYHSKLILEQKYALDQHALVSITDASGKITYVNEKFCEVSQYQKSELIGQDHRIINSKHHSKDYFKELWCTISEGKVWKGEINNKTKNGTNFWVDTTIIPFLDDKKRPYQYLAIRTNITQMKANEDLIIKADHDKQAIFDAAEEVAIIATRLDGVVSVFNVGAEKMLGYSAHEVVEKQTPIVWHDASEIEARATELSKTKGRQVVGFDVFIQIALHPELKIKDWIYVRKDGKCLNVNLSITTLTDENDNVIGLLGVALDVTDRIKAEENLMKQKIDLEKANLELDSFVYTASHDLRAPLRGISAFATFLEEDYRDKLDEEGVHYLNRIRRGANKMTDLIDDLLSLSRISRQENPYEKVDIAELINSVLDRIEFDLSDNNVELNIQDNLPTLKCDRIKMGEVFLNLINNGIKFSSRMDSNPIITIGCEERSTDYRFFVKDNGIGIDPQYHTKVFGIFKRLHDENEYEGTGAGLSIVKRVVEDHKGQIWIESEENKGACFNFTIPKSLNNSSSV